MISIIIAFFLATSCVHASDDARETTEKLKKLSIMSPEICQRKHEVAVMIPARHTNTLKIFNHINGTLYQQGISDQYHLKFYDCGGDSNYLEIWAEKIATSKHMVPHDIVVPIGTACIQAIYKAAQKYNKKIPMICVGGDPTFAGVTQQNYPCTAVMESPNFARQLQELLKIKPEIKRIGLLYSPNSAPHQETRKEEWKKVIEDAGLTFNSLVLKPPRYDCVYNLDTDLYPHTDFLNNADIILILKDHVVCIFLERIAAWCKKYDKQIYASDHTSLNEGASYSYGVPTKLFGVKAAELLVRILAKKEPIISIPFIDMAPEATLRTASSQN